MHSPHSIICLRMVLCFYVDFLDLKLENFYRIINFKIFQLTLIFFFKNFLYYHSLVIFKNVSNCSNLVSSFSLDENPILGIIHSFCIFRNLPIYFRIYFMSLISILDIFSSETRRLLLPTRYRYLYNSY